MEQLKSWLSNEDNYLILHGEIGCGKTYLCEKSLSEAKCNPIIFDFDNKTTYQALLNTIKESYGFKVFWNYVYIFDNAHIYFSDKSEIDFLSQQFPDIKIIFIIVNEEKSAFEKKIKFTRHMFLQVEPPLASVIKKKHNLKQTATEIKQLIKKYKSDLRQVIYNCQYAELSTKDFQFSNMYDILHFAFRKKIDTKSLIQSCDVFSGPVMVHENYTKCKKTNMCNVSLDVLIGDLFHTYMYKNACWDFSEYVIFASVISPLEKCSVSNIEIKYGSVLSKIMNCQTRKKTMKRIFNEYNVSDIQELQCVYTCKHYYKNGNFVKLKKKDLSQIEKIITFTSWTNTCI
jgi:DNA-binding ferritin-like protein (Dps family)